MDVDKQEVTRALSRVIDPELRRDIVDLGMVRETAVTDHAVVVTLALTIPGCPMKDRLAADVKREVGDVPGVKNVDVVLETMNDDEKRALAEKLGRKVRPLSVSVKTTVIGIASGKGGVGKSTVTVNLAAAMARSGCRVGLLDADIWGFSVPRMLGISDRPRVADGAMIPPEKYSIKLMSTGFFIDENQPVIWRGPLIHRAIEQFLTEVLWGELDYLLLDLPPGTGDVMITAAKLIPDLKMVMVTTPQPVASNVAVRAGHMAHKAGVSVIGVIENMAYIACGQCGEKNYIFGRGGGDELARALGAPVIGRIPFDPRGREGGDTGMPIVLSDPESPTSVALLDIARTLIG
jgi:ATP-binding protein involved in chromosome partitioning